MGNRIITLIIAYMIVINCSAQSNFNLNLTPITLPQVIIYKKVDSLTIFDINKSARRLFILKNKKFCSKCYEEINDAIITSNLFKNKTADIETYILNLCDSTIFSMRSNYYENRQLLPIVNNNLYVFYPTYSENLSDLASIFKTYNITITPAIIIQLNSTFFLTKYEKLFDSAGKLKSETLAEIIKVLKE